MFGNKIKIMVIFSTMIAVFLCFVIWSSNVVAEHEAEKFADKTAPIEVGIPLMHAEDLEADIDEEEEVVEEEEEDKPYDIGFDVYPDVSANYGVATKKVGSNYARKALQTKPLILWNPKSFPLKVYLQDSANYPERFETEIKKAFENWTYKTNDFITFTYVDNQNDANIIVSVTNNAKNCESAACHSDYRFETVDNKLLKAYLEIPQIDCKNKVLEANSVIAKVSHDVGHLLGIVIHNDSTDSVMYPELTPYNYGISAQDADTLRYMYMFTPEITNVPYSQSANYATLKQIEGMSERAFSDFILERLPEVESTLFEKTVNEADTYYDAENYKKAISVYEKAIKTTEVGIEQAYAYKKMALAYLQLGDAESAHKYGVKAQNVSPSVTTRYFTCYVKYKSGRYDEASAHINQLLEKYPQTRQAYSLLGLIYVKQGKWVKVKELSDEMQQKYPDEPPFIFNYIPEKDYVDPVDY